MYISYHFINQVAGMVGKVVEYPFDTVKVRLQTQSVETPLFQGPMDCLKATMKEEGFKGLFKVKKNNVF